jgi:hypothetical protein
MFFEMIQSPRITLALHTGLFTFGTYGAEILFKQEE